MNGAIIYIIEHIVGGVGDDLPKIESLGGVWIFLLERGG